MEMLDYLLSAMTDAVMAYNLNERSYIFVSPAIENITGYKPEEYKNNPNLFNSIIYTEDRAIVDEFTKSLKVPDEKEITYRINTKDTSVRWIQEKRVQFIHDTLGHPIILNILKDITDVVTFKEEAKHQVWFLNSLIEAQEALIFRIDKDGNYTYVNQAYTRMLGYQKEKLIGKSIYNISYSSDISRLKAAFSDCINNPGKIITVLHRKVNDAGHTRWINATCVAVANANNEIIEIQGTGFDVSELEEAKMTVENILEKLNFYLDSITDAFFILDKEWRFLRVNSAWEKQFARNRADVLGRLIWDVLPAAIGTPFEDGFKKAVVEQQTFKFIASSPISKRWFRVSAYPSDEGLAVLMRDFTREKESEEQAMWTKHNLEGIINNTNDMIWSVDKNKVYVFANDAYKKWLKHNFDIDHLEGSKLYEQLYDNESVVQEWTNYYDRVLAGERFSIDFESYDKCTNELISFEVSFNPIYDENNNVSGAGCFAHNVTLRLKFELAIQEQNERLRNIASLSSHELRRPVATIIGLIDILDKENLNNPENHEIVKHLQTESYELDSVIKLIVNKTFIDNIK